MEVIHTKTGLVLQVKKAHISITKPKIVGIHVKIRLVLKVKIVSRRVCQKSLTEVEALVSFSGDMHMSIGLMTCQKGAW